MPLASQADLCTLTLLPNPVRKAQELRRIFTEMDADNSGTISLDEMRAVMQRYIEPSVDLERLYKVAISRRHARILQNHLIS